MKKIFKKLLMVLSLTGLLLANCSQKRSVWQRKIAQSASLERFFMNHYTCQKSFYKHLSTAQKIYFDTVVYPNGLNETAYKNRWRAMLFDDKAFFKTFTFFNNYFSKHHNSVTSKELSCFQRQKGLTFSGSKNRFYHQLAQKDKLHDVSYLYPLIRWAYVHNGVDMQLSRERVQKAQRAFGMHQGKVGDNEQFARFIALFDEEYESVAKALAMALTVSKLKAYKLLVILTYLESRGNIFAVSTTGAFGPTQLTLHYYMMYGEPNNPFSVKGSLAKLANKFVHYHRIGKSIDASVIAYKSGSLRKCQNGQHPNDADCRYYHAYKRYMQEMAHLSSKHDIVKKLTGKSYFSNGLKHLNRAKNPYGLRDYEPYQYAVLKGGTLRERAQKSQYLNGGYFNSLGRMKRSDIYELQDRFGVRHVGVVSDKKVCY
jgi:hypothetical protein